jgi:hypothetical protein
MILLVIIHAKYNKARLNDSTAYGYSCRVVQCRGRARVRVAVPHHDAELGRSREVEHPPAHLGGAPAPDLKFTGLARNLGQLQGSYRDF